MEEIVIARGVCMCRYHAAAAAACLLSRERQHFPENRCHPHPSQVRFISASRARLNQVTLDTRFFQERLLLAPTFFCFLLFFPLHTLHFTPSANDTSKKCRPLTYPKHSRASPPSSNEPPSSRNENPSSPTTVCYYIRMDDFKSDTHRTLGTHSGLLLLSCVNT